MKVGSLIILTILELRVELKQYEKTDTVRYY